MNEASIRVKEEILVELDAVCKPEVAIAMATPTIRIKYTSALH
jgi:hypothetical protein